MDENRKAVLYQIYYRFPRPGEYCDYFYKPDRTFFEGEDGRGPLKSEVIRDLYLNRNLVGIEKFTESDVDYYSELDDYKNDRIQFIVMVPVNG